MEKNKTLSIIALVAMIAIVGIVVAFAVVSTGNVQTSSKLYIKNSDGTTNLAGMMKACGNLNDQCSECGEDEQGREFRYVVSGGTNVWKDYSSC